MGQVDEHVAGTATPADDGLRAALKKRFGDSPLIEALFLVHGQRAEDYGNPLDNCQRIADFWSVLFAQKVEVWQVPLAMNLVKVARLMNEPTHFDGKADGGGYFEVLDVLQKEQKKRRMESDLFVGVRPPSKEQLEAERSATVMKEEK